MGELTYVPVSPASQRWGFDISSCTYGSDTITPTPIAGPGVVDLGSPSVFALYACRDTYLFSCRTAILIPDDLLRVYMDTIPGAKFDTKTELIEIPPSSIRHIQPLHFTFGNREFTLDVNSQLLPQEMYTTWEADAGKCYSVVSSIGRVIGLESGLDFVFGIPFMEKYYTVSSSGSCFEKSILNGHPWQVHDAGRQRIGFAQAYVFDTCYGGIFTI